MSNSTPLKKCCRCNQLKPATTEHFLPRKNSKDGLEGRCRECERKRLKQRYHDNVEHYRLLNRESKQRHKDKRNEETRQWFAAHPNYRRQWDREHPKKVKQYKARTRLRRREYISSYNKQYYSANPERMSTHRARRRARIWKATGQYTPQDVIDILEIQEGRCAYCGIPTDDDYHIDHMIPLSRGGSNDQSNICIACPKCNLSKGARTPKEFSEYLLEVAT